MASSEEQRARIEANRKRYEELKAAGQAPRALPPPTAVGDRPIAADALIHRETVPGGWYWTTRLARGEALRLVNRTGASSVALLAWNRHDRSERFLGIFGERIVKNAQLRTQLALRALKIGGPKAHIPEAPAYG